MKPKILLIAPHINIAEPFRTALEKNGFAVTVADSSSMQSRSPRTEQFALVINLQQNDRHETGDAAICSHPIDATFLSPNRAFPGLVQTFQNGAYRLGGDEADVDKFVNTVRELLSDPSASCQRDRQQVTSNQRRASSNQSQHSGDPDSAGQRATSNRQLDLIGQSPQIEEVRQRIKCYSQFPNVSVLITGETGAGKEVVANLLHYSSPRADKPLIKVNCSAISEALFESQFFGHRKGAFTSAHEAQKGLVEAAQDGTLFLDEISTLKPEQQPKLLRLLEDGSYLPIGETQERRTNAWIIAASNKNLKELVKENLFREDLYYRLKAAEIKLPPLRERREDVALLSKKFLEQFSSQYGVGAKFLSELAEKALQRHNWPGNVRELKQVMSALMISVKGDMILPEHLPAEFIDTEKATVNKKEKLSTLNDVEREHILHVLEETGFNLSQTAKYLEISRNALKRKMKKYKIPVVRNGPFRG